MNVIVISLLKDILKTTNIFTSTSSLPVAFVPRPKVAVIVSATIAHLVATIVVSTTIIVITASIVITVIAIVVVAVPIIRSHVVAVVDTILSYCSKKYISERTLSKIDYLHGSIGHFHPL